MATKFDRSDQDNEVDLGKLFFKFIILLKRRIKILSIFTIIGGTLGLAYYIFSPPVYYSSMTISTGILTTFNSKTLFSTLETLIQERNYSTLAKKLNLEVDEVNNINSISVVALARDEEDTDKANLFQVEVYILDQDILERLQAGIIYYLEENPYVKKRIDIRKKNLESLKEKVNKELLGLDTLKEKLSSNINMSRDNNVVILDPVNAYIETVNLFQKELDLQFELELIDNIQVIENFTHFDKKVSPRFRYVIFGLLIGFFIGVFLILLKEIIYYTKSIEIQES